MLHREIEVGYCKLVTISTDNLLDTNEFRSGMAAHWPFLSDPGRKVQKALDIAEYTDPHHDPMVPHTIVLEPGLVVHKIYNGYWFFGRPTIEELRLDLRAVTARRSGPTGTCRRRACGRGSRPATTPTSTPTARPTRRSSRNGTRVRATSQSGSTLLYGTGLALHDITSGSNGTCAPAYLCTAGTGYDGPTGLGTPNGILGF